MTRPTPRSVIDPMKALVATETFIRIGAKNMPQMQNKPAPIITVPARANRTRPQSGVGGVYLVLHVLHTRSHRNAIPVGCTAR